MATGTHDREQRGPNKGDSGPRSMQEEAGRQQVRYQPRNLVVEAER